MTTDAHMLVEVKLARGWTVVSAPIWPNASPNREKNNDPIMGPVPGLPRSYGLYSVLADVRNRTNRMGSVEMTHEVDGVEYPFTYDMDDGGHESIVAFSFPKGIPDDAFVGWKEFCEQEMIHDPTWLTLDEIPDDHPLWDQVLWEDAVVMEDEYLHWKETGEMPKYLARGVGGPGVITVNEAEYQDGKRGEEGTGVQFRYRGKTVREDAGSGWWAIYALMKLLGVKYGNDHVRMLLAFDS